MVSSISILTAAPFLDPHCHAAELNGIYLAINPTIAHRLKENQIEAPSYVINWNAFISHLALLL
jgi:hypothetical protein